MEGECYIETITWIQNELSLSLTWVDGKTLLLAATAWIQSPEKTDIAFTVIKNNPSKEDRKLLAQNSWTYRNANQKL